MRVLALTAALLVGCGAIGGPGGRETDCSSPGVLLVSSDGGVVGVMVGPSSVYLREAGCSAELLDTGNGYRWYARHPASVVYLGSDCSGGPYTTRAESDGVLVSQECLQDARGQWFRHKAPMGHAIEIVPAARYDSDGGCSPTSHTQPILALPLEAIPTPTPPEAPLSFVTCE